MRLIEVFTGFSCRGLTLFKISLRLMITYLVFLVVVGRIDSLKDSTRGIFPDIGITIQYRSGYIIDKAGLPRAAVGRK